LPFFNTKRHANKTSHVSKACLLLFGGQVLEGDLHFKKGKKDAFVLHLYCVKSLK